MLCLSHLELRSSLANLFVNFEMALLPLDYSRLQGSSLVLDVKVVRYVNSQLRELFFAPQLQLLVHVLDIILALQKSSSALLRHW